MEKTGRYNRAYRRTDERRSVSQRMDTKEKQELGRGQKLWKLFTATLYISTFTFGGGFVIITFMKKKFVDELHWIDEQEMLDLAALAQASPGAIAVNAAILIGWRVAGFPGMLVAVLGTVLPPMVILTIISYIYATFVSNPYVAMLLKGMQAGVAAVIMDVVLSLGGSVLKKNKVLNLLIMLAAFSATFFFGINVIWIIVVTAVISVIVTLWRHRKGAQA